MSQCGTCSRIAGRTPAEAVWRWWTHGGRYSNDLCESCAASWMIGCATDEDLSFHVEAIGTAARVERG